MNPCWMERGRGSDGWGRKAWCVAVNWLLPPLSRDCSSSISIPKVLYSKGSCEKHMALDPLSLSCIIMCSSCPSCSCSQRNANGSGSEMGLVRWVVPYVLEINQSYSSAREASFLVEEIQNTNCDAHTTASSTVRRNLIDAISVFELMLLHLSMDVCKTLL